MNKDLLKYSFPQKERIFDLDHQYAVVQHVSDLWYKEDTLYVEVTLSNIQKSTLKFTLLAGGIINLQFNQKILNDRFNAHLNPIKTIPLSYRETTEQIEIDLIANEKIVIIKKPFQLCLYDKNGVIKFATNNRKGYKVFSDYIAPPLGWKKIDHNYQVPFMSLWLHNNEKIYGLGEKFRPLIKNGIESTIWNSDNSCVANHDLSYNGLPLLFSTNKWGVLVNTGHRTTFEIGSPVTDAISFLSNEECLDLYFFSADSMKGLITQYTGLTGRTKAVPDISYGIWCNRLYYHNKVELWQEITKSQQAEFPLDVICLDPKWLNNRYTKSCNFDYNTNAFGDFKTLFAELKAANIEVCFWINPYLQSDNSPQWKKALEHEYLVKNINQNDYAHPITGTETYQENCGIVDFTNPDAKEWYQNEIKKLFALGLRFVKPDYGDGIPNDALFYNQKTSHEFRQYYEYLFCETAYQASEQFFGPNQTLVFCRPGYIGTQRFSGKWSGDSYSNFTELKIHLQAGLSLGFAGEALWGTDIGGFQSNEPFDEDLYMRWTQIGMLCPLSRFHGYGPREPWNFTPAALKNAQKYAQLKRKLLPYFKKCELEATETGLPILRAMVLENEDDPIARNIDDQFYVGANLLIAPIWTKETYAREVYLPKGEWYLWANKTTKYQGNQQYHFDCLGNEILIFVKANSIIPMINEDKYHFSDLSALTIALECYGDELYNEEITFYLDNKITKITFKNNKINVESPYKYIIKNN